MKLRLLGGALGIALLVAHGAAQAQTVTHKLTFASGYPAAFAWTDEQVKTFLPGVNKELEKAGSKHRVEWNVAVGGTLATMPNMLDAVSTGLADMGHVVHLFEPARLPLQNVVSAAPFATDDPRLATKVLHDMQKTMPAMQKSWSNLNLVYLTSYSFDSYLLISRRPVASVTDVKGMKVAAAASNTLWLEGTGASPVAATMGTAYNDMKTGVYDAAINSALLSAAGKMYEVAPQIVRTGFGAINAFDIVFNKASWDRLPAEVRQAIQRAADAHQEAMVARIERETDAAFETMRKHDAAITALSADERVKWANTLPNIAERWAAPLEAKGLPAREVLRTYVENLRKAGAQPARDWTRP
ncbi:C4-dicarboxylate TRAP transporter substrate-binding protein [Variovorax sp.]|uniref:C4-dicarboxylate TRAP transporter substrate-binding protein n=1 Tax=Variovorax sp. TaxID=1871043 RepID=UPI002D2F6225|nr:C4-dicarboxylate TRAP transporter substrate-binding protein [Variovorax sp.]HYP85489.1 C4-dicarboxylate TRAP transporter substrate-binding protein [Variovorax sp.]